MDESKNMPSVPMSGAPMTSGGGTGQLPGTFKLLGKAFSGYKTQFSKIFGLAVAPALLAIISIFVTDKPVFYGIIQLVSIVVGVLFYVALIRQVSGTASASVVDSYKGALPFFWGYLWAAILSSLVFLGSFLLLVIPGIFFAVALIFAPLVLVEENKRGREALIASWRYVSGRWWKVFGRLLLACILIGLIMAIVMGIIGAVNQTTGAVVTSLVAYLFMIPFMIMFLVELLRGLKSLPVSSAPDNKKGVVTGFAIWGLVAIPLFVLTVGLVVLLG